MVRVLWGLLLALLLVCIPREAVALPVSTAGIETTLQVCPAFELTAQAWPLEPVRDPDPTNNVHQQAIFVCPR